MKELEKMTQDQQRGYVLAELIYGLGKALVNGIKETEIYETTENQLALVLKMESSFKQALVLFKAAMVEDTDKLEVMLEKAVGAPKALDYE